MSFARFVALDWSGARRADGIAIAACSPGRSAPRLIPPPDGRRWTRTQALAWVAEVVAGGRALVGFDFAFSLPFERAARYFAAADPAVADLWGLVDGIDDGALDLWGGGFAIDPRFAPDFWRIGPRPAGYVEPHRATDRACREAGLGAPESPYKLIGARQVGLGALAGMRLLNRLQGAAAVWPFDGTAGRSVLVEIYPRLFLRLAGAGNRKVRSWGELAGVLSTLGSRTPKPTPQAPSDHDTDALVAAAGLRTLAADARLWDAPRHDRVAMRREGWIFGVPAPRNLRPAEV